MLLLVTTIQSYALNYTIIFTASGVTTSVGSVQVQNLTKGTTVTVPDGNTLNLTDVTAVDELNANNSAIRISQNAATGKSTLTFYASQAGSAQVAAYALDGRKVAGLTTRLETGDNSLELALPAGMYIIHLSGTRYAYSAKLESQASLSSKAEIKFVNNIKVIASSLQKSKTTTATTTMSFNADDQLLYTATSGTYIASVHDVPTGSYTTNFVFFLIPTSAIPTGTFIMGSPTTEVSRNADENQHSVTLSAYHMSKYEITNAQYAAFLNAKSISNSSLPSYIYSSLGLTYNGTLWTPVTGYENAPVIKVTWWGAIAYAAYVGGALPSEAQWEYSCRAGTTTPFSTGNFLTNLQANYYWLATYNGVKNDVTTYPGKPKPVGSYAANAFGLYDMHGNAMEWCTDLYCGNYPDYAQTNPTGGTSSTLRVYRGGNWRQVPEFCRSAWRNCYSEWYSSDYLGFRVVFLQ